MLKSHFPDVANRISLKIGRFFSRFNLHPNTWTLLSLLFGFLGFSALVQKSMLLGLMFFIISGFLDAIDGGVARVSRKVSKLGGYLDGIIDRINECLLLIGLMIFGLPNLTISNVSIPPYIFLALLLFFGSALVSYSRAYACQKKIITDEKTLNKMPGILERTERLLLIGIGMILYFFNPIFLTWIIFIAFILSFITFLQRVFFTIKRARRVKDEGKF